MKRHTLAIVSVVALIATVIAWNTLGAKALSIADEKTDTPPVEEHIASDGKPVIAPSIRLWPRPQVSESSAGDLLYRLDGGRLGLPSMSLAPEATNTPAAPLPAPTNTPAAPVGDVGATLERLPPAWTGTEIGNSSPSSAPAAGLLPETDDHAEHARQRADALRQAGVRFRVPDGGTWTPAHVSPLSTSEETCVDVLLNPQLDVVEFGDGTGSIEYWSILYQNVYYDSEEYNSSSYSLILIDENDGSDTVLDPFWGTGMDYDMFGQGFRTPSNLTYLRVSYSRLYADANENDQAWANLWTLDSEGYLDQLVDYVSIGESPDGWSNRYWELDSSLLAQASGKTLAVVFDMLSDMTAPGEWVWLDDVQVTLCYESGQYGVYLPLIVKQPSTPSQPTCSPREPDSVSQPGSTTVDVTCGGSFSAVDQKDYYTLDLDGASKVRLHLSDLPSGTNWDALIYENIGGYPLACQIGTPGDADKQSDNCSVNQNKNYFVLVSRGPNRTAGSYRMRVERR